MTESASRRVAPAFAALTWGHTWCATQTPGCVRVHDIHDSRESLKKTSRHTIT